MLETQPSLMLLDARIPETASKKAFAEMVGVTPGRVSQLITAGLPVEPNRRINVARGREWMRANIDPNRRRASIDVDPASPSVFASPTTPRGARDIAEAEIARLKAGRLSGRMMDRRAALRIIEGRAKFERDAWIGWVNRAAPLIAAETSADLGLVVSILDREVRAQLLTLAELPLELPR